MGDNVFIFGYCFFEWCGYGFIFEQDIVMINIVFDQVGQVCSLLQYVVQFEGKGCMEDDLVYKWDVMEYWNVFLVEQFNEDFVYIIVWQFLFDIFNFFFYKSFVYSEDEYFKVIVEKLLKEIIYYLWYSFEWMICLGDGIVESY